MTRTHLETCADMLRNTNVFGIASCKTIDTVLTGPIDLNIAQGDSCLKFIFLDGEFQGIEERP